MPSSSSRRVPRKKFCAIVNERSDGPVVTVKLYVSPQRDVMGFAELCSIRNRLDTMYLNIVRFCYATPVPAPVFDGKGRLTYDYIEQFETHVHGVKMLTKDVVGVVRTEVQARTFFYDDVLRQKSQIEFGRYQSTHVFSSWMRDVETVQAEDAALRADRKGSVARDIQDIAGAFALLCHARMVLDVCVMLQGRCEVCGQTSEDIGVCAGCTRTWYCSETCQKADWKKHKLNCERADKRKQPT